MADLWKYTLARSSDMEEIGDLNAKGRKLSLGLNLPGSAQFYINHHDDYALALIKRKTCIIAKRNGVPKWSGQVASLDYDLESGTINVGCFGWLKNLDFRFVRAAASSQAPATTYTLVDDGLMIHNMLDLANTIQGTMTGAPSSSFMVKGSRETPGVARTKKLESGQSIGEEIQTLVNLENGRDIWVDPITRELNVYVDLGETRSNMIFGYDTGADNLKNVKHLETADTQFNREFVQGSAAGGVVYAEEANNIAEYGLIENIDQVSDEGQATILAAYANERLAVYLNHSVFEIFPKQWKDDEDNAVPQPFVDYNVGDRGVFSCKSPRLNIDNQPIRCFGLDVSIDDDGNESIDKITTNLG